MIFVLENWIIIKEKQGRIAEMFMDKEDAGAYRRPFQIQQVQIENKEDDILKITDKEGKVHIVKTPWYRQATEEEISYEKIRTMFKG